MLTSGAVHRLPHVAEPERRRYLQSALRRAGSGARLTIVAAPADLAWARWVEAVLLAGGAQVEVCGPDAEAEAVLQGRPVVLLSEALLRSVAGQKPVGLPGAVCVRIGAVAPEGAPEDVVDLVHLEEAPATRQLLQALLPERGDESVPPVSAPSPAPEPRSGRFLPQPPVPGKGQRTDGTRTTADGTPGGRGHRSARGGSDGTRPRVRAPPPARPRIVWWASAAEDGALRGALAELRRRVPQLHTAGAATEVLLIVDGVVRPDQVLAAVSAVGARLVLTGRWEALARLPADVPLLTLGPSPPRTLSRCCRQSMTTPGSWCTCWPGTPGARTCAGGCWPPPRSTRPGCSRNCAAPDGRHSSPQSSVWRSPSWPAGPPPRCGCCGCARRRAAPRCPRICCGMTNSCRNWRSCSRTRWAGAASPRCAGSWTTWASSAGRRARRCSAATPRWARPCSPGRSRPSCRSAATGCTGCSPRTTGGWTRTWTATVPGGSSTGSGRICSLPGRTAATTPACEVCWWTGCATCGGAASQAPPRSWRVCCSAAGPPGRWTRTGGRCGCAPNSGTRYGPRAGTPSRSPSMPPPWRSSRVASARTMCTRC
ncbi:hypothetical protein ACFQZC_16580 [Streptacidiphilus monticola]